MKSSFILAMLCLSIANIASGVQATLRWPYLSSLPTQAPLAWLIGGKWVWGVAFGVTAWGVGRSKVWGRKAALLCVTLYQVHIWINHILFDTSDYARQVWPFAAGLSLMTLAVVWAYVAAPDLRRLYQRTVCQNRVAETPLSDRQMDRHKAS